MEHPGQGTRVMLIVIWSIAAVALAVWSLLAMGGHALLSDSGAWLATLIDPWIASPAWDARLQSLLAWGESASTVAVWVLWALGSLGLVLSCAFASMLYRRAHRAMAR